MDYKVQWRVVYKRSMFDRTLRGYKEKDAFKFFDDFKNLCADYAAYLEYQMLPGSPWKVFSMIFVNRTNSLYYLIDENGDKIEQSNTFINRNVFTQFLKEQCPTPRQFLSVINAKERYFDMYKQ